MKLLKPTKGRLLIAEPSLTGDVSFNRSVLLLAEHNAEGTIGFILNKLLEYELSDLVQEIKISFALYNGGPVDQDNLYFIHNVPHLIANSVEISEGIYWGGDFDSVVMLLNKKIITKNDVRFFLGYSGWAPLQLADELSIKSWIVVTNDYKDQIIRQSTTAFWKEKIAALGGDYLLWSNAPENPSLN